jgi:hypothetical protein
MANRNDLMLAYADAHPDATPEDVEREVNAYITKATSAPKPATDKPKAPRPSTAAPRGVTPPPPKVETPQPGEVAAKYARADRDPPSAESRRRAEAERAAVTPQTSLGRLARSIREGAKTLNRWDHEAPSLGELLAPGDELAESLSAGNVGRAVLRESGNAEDVAWAAYAPTVRDVGVGLFPPKPASPTPPAAKPGDTAAKHTKPYGPVPPPAPPKKSVTELRRERMKSVMDAAEVDAATDEWINETWDNPAFRATLPAP